MIRTGSSLLKFYLTHPSVAVRHVGRAAHAFRAGGTGQLLALIQTRAGATSQGIETRRVERQLRQRFVGLAKTQKRNADTLLAALLPHADDLSVLDIVHGTEERLRLVHCHILKKYQLLDEEFYARKYLEGVTTIQPADHYMQFGLPNGLQPNPFFDPLAYVSANPDVADWGMDPVIHYALFGWREGRSACPLFDGAFYLATNPDVAEKTDLSPLIHFLQYGRYEQRAPRRGGSCEFGSGLAELPRKSGTLVLVSHDAELGGAQQVIRVFAQWLLSATRYDVRLVTVCGGAFADSFSQVAPTFDLSAHPAGEVASRLEDFVGKDVKAVFINSIASGGFLKHWHRDTPVIAFVHELPKVLRLFEGNVELIRERASTIIGGSEAVRMALCEEFGIAKERLATVYGFIESLALDRLGSFEEKRSAKESLGLDPDAFLVTACGVVHWRKSPDKFIEVAERVAAHQGESVQFVWIGGGPDQAVCEEMVAKKGLGDFVRFTGYEPDIMRFLKASDVFLLPSEEDPFPLVCLYAAIALNPVVCFKEAGGMPEFTSRGCGRAVDFGDVDAMASAVLDYISDDEMRRREGTTGRALVEAEYTVATTGPQLLHHIREAAGLSPQVSVIVPNYNYERFLGERLQSIAEQTFQDFEVILLDDKSSDESVPILEKWAAKRPGTRLVVNEVNSGSPFAQWIRGMRLAQSELVWIAEADDDCHPALIESLLPYFDDRNVFLGHAKSVPVDEAGIELGNYETLYLNRIAKGRWSRSFVATDHEEANEGLGIANCIPNASSVVLRRFEPEPEFEATVTGMRLCGDWFFYLRAMRGGLIAYHERPLNFHRRHGATITSQTEGSRRYFDEAATVRDHVAQHYILDPEAAAAVERFATEDIDRFGIREEAERKRILTAFKGNHEKKVMPTILVVVSDFSPGGGQMFGIRLANAWVKRGGRAILLNVGQFADHPQVMANIDSHVAVFDARSTQMTMAELVRRFDVDVIHSSIWWADRFVQDHIAELVDVPWLVTMHGCYETHLNNPSIDLSFRERMRNLLTRVDMWVYLAEKNTRVFDVCGAPRKIAQIANGIEVSFGVPYSRATLGVREDAVVLCLASRAIPEKGWLAAAEITERLNKLGHRVDLMLLGEGPAADVLRREPREHVHLYGHVSDTQAYFGATDIGILPTFFEGESQPLTLLEFMANGIPVISTDIGEIPAMIGLGMQAAGCVVPLKNEKVDVDAFIAATIPLLDQQKRRKAGQNAEERFEGRYTTECMLNQYEQAYRDLLHERTKAP